MALLLAALAAPAFAADFSDLRFGPSFGIEGVINDPFLNRNGIRQGFNVAPVPWVEVGVAVGYYPILGQGGENDPDWKPLSKQLLLRNSVSPDISKLVWQAQAVVRVHALQVPLGKSWEAGFGLLAGATVVGTQDDLVALQNDDESAVLTQNQVHPGTVSGIFWDASYAGLTLRVRFEHDAYIETINSTTLEMKKNGMLGAEVMWWF